MRKRAYSATRVNHVDWKSLIQGKEGLDAAVGVDVGKYEFLAECRWADGRFERPWRVKNPCEIGDFVGFLKRLGEGRLAATR